MRLRYLGLTLILAILTAAGARAELALLDPEVQKKSLAKAEQLYAGQDSNGLLKLLKESHLFIKKDIALKLGRLGAAEALGDLRECDRRYSRFACAESGEFGVAIILIENKTPDRQKKALLAVATEKREQPKHAHSVIDAAGRELSRFSGEDVAKALADVNTYGAQYAVLRLQCGKLSPSAAIARCIAVLEAHETPQKAEAAEDMLASFGKSAESAVHDLKTRTEKRIQPTGPTFTIPRTVVHRCDRVLTRIKEQEAAVKELSAEERRLVGTWRFSKTVYSDDNKEGTQLMILRADRTWLHATYSGREDVPTAFRKIVRGPRWVCREGRLVQYHPPPKGGGSHTYDRRIESVTPTTLAFEYTRKPWLGPVEYTRVRGETAAKTKKLLEKSD